MTRKKHAFLQKKILGQIAIHILCSKNVSTDFQVEKKREKKCKKRVPGIWMGIKIASKMIHFTCKIMIMLLCKKSLFFTFPGIQMVQKE